MGWGAAYREAYDRYASDPDAIIEVEEKYCRLLLEVILAVASSIERDWNHAADTVPVWIERAPKQRGNAPSGLTIPWIEVAEYVPLSHVTAEFGRRFGMEARFPGLPTGGDLRVATDDALIHLDAKAAGPNDRHDEVVVPPYQISGDGNLSEMGRLAPNASVVNSVLTFPGRNKSGRFHPSLPPVYVYPDGTYRLCVTAFLKVVYTVTGLGIQPLDHMTLAIVPNGLLLHKHGMGQKAQLFARGKDATSKPLKDKRCRIMFAPLAAIAPWRVQTVSRGSDDDWEVTPWRGGLADP